MNWNKKDIINICKVIAFGIILYWALQNLVLLGGWFTTIRSILSPFIAGIAIAFVINIPMTLFENTIFKGKKNKLSKKKKDNLNEIKKVSKLKRSISIILSFAMVILIIIGIIFLIIPELINVIKEMILYLPQLAENAKQLIKQIIIEHPEVEGTLTSFQTNLEQFNTEAIKQLTTLGTNLVTSSFGMISSTFSIFFKAIIAIIFSIYLLMGKETILRFIKRMTYAYMKKENADKACRITELSRKAFNNFITGQFTECIILGTLCGLGMFILRIPYSATIGTLVAITAFIPIVGAMIGAVVGIILLLPISFTKAIIFLVFFVILQQIENNLIYPRVVGNSVGIPGVLVLVAVTVGGALGGAVGMIIGLPITAVLYTLLCENTNKRLEEKGLEEERKIEKILENQ